MPPHVRSVLLVALLLSGCETATAGSPAPMAMPMPKAAAALVAARAHVDAAWVRAAPPGTTTLAGYMVVRNDGTIPLELVSASSDAFGMVALHRTQVVNGISTMRPAGDQTIQVGGSLRIEPGGLHLMLMQPTRALKPGDRVRLTLRFADGSSTSAIAVVSDTPPKP